MQTATLPEKGNNRLKEDATAESSTTLAKDWA
jgi:hypothetical protein